ncbi:CcmD family protein [Desulfocurvus sp. DL9XJH121]
MDYQTYLLAANVAVWLGIGGFVALLAARQKALAARVRQMEMLADD